MSTEPELTFAKTFLSILDTKPSKLARDYAIDLRTLELTSGYTLPYNKNGKPMVRTSHSQTIGTGTDSKAAPGSERAVSVSLKSLKNPPLDLTLPVVELGTTVLELKRRVAEKVGLEGVEKVRLLWKKKPVGDVKTVEEIVGSETSVEFGVMVIGGVVEKSAEAGSAEPVPVAMGESGEDVLMTDVFWSDLRGFLEQRVRNQEVAETAGRVFRDAWKNR